MSALVLADPLDSGKLFLDTDVSDWGILRILSQVQGGGRESLGIWVQEDVLILYFYFLCLFSFMTSCNDAGVMLKV